MEKKGDILNQLAIIADLLEKANIDSNQISVAFELDKKNFNGIYEIITKKTKSDIDVETTFMVRIGNVEFNFSISKNSA